MHKTGQWWGGGTSYEVVEGAAVIDGCSWRLASADSLWSLGLTRGLQPTKGVAECSATRMSVTARRRFSGHLPVAVFSSANKLIHIVILRNDL